MKYRVQSANKIPFLFKATLICFRNASELRWKWRISGLPNATILFRTIAFRTYYPLLATKKSLFCWILVKSESWKGRYSNKSISIKDMTCFRLKKFRLTSTIKLFAVILYSIRFITSSTSRRLLTHMQLNMKRERSSLFTLCYHTCSYTNHYIGYSASS